MLHQKITASRKGIVNDPTYFEKSAHTQALLPATPIERPSPEGVPVKLVADAGNIFGAMAGHWKGPMAVIDPKHEGRPWIVLDGDGWFGFITHQNGQFPPVGNSLPGPGGTPSKILVGDLNNDRREDLILVSSEGWKVFRQGEDLRFIDVTEESGLGGVKATNAVLADYDVTGKLGIIAATEAGPVFYRNQGTGIFEEATGQLQLPKLPESPRDFVVDDWNGDDLPDIFVASDDQPVQVLLNQRAGQFRTGSANDPPLSPTTPATAPAAEPDAPWPSGSVLAVGDLNGDLRNDVVVATKTGLEFVWGGTNERSTIPVADLAATHLHLLDYDNDGWLDLVTTGPTLRLWRNLGLGKFQETTDAVGAGSISARALASADFDADGDTDLMIEADDGSIHFLRNDGGNANRQIKVELTTTRSNGSGLGTRFELIADGWRASRTVHSLPIEIGVGSHDKIESFSIHWADLVTNLGAVSTAPDQQPIKAVEPELPTGSCPYLYVWDGKRFRFVTDLLGAAPAGLRLTDTLFIEADTEELIGMGDETNVVPHDGDYIIQITDELRELLFFDQVELVAVDRPPDIEAQTTSKLRPRKPWVPHELVAFKDPLPLLEATRSDGADVTAALRKIDRRRVSPVKLRAPQLRGLAEPYSVTLDFGPLPVDRQLVLALNGWLRFGGGMANVAASHDPTLPFPFPTLEVETADGQWQSVDVVCGAPAGKTKSIIIDLEGKLPVGAHRLRLTQAFEIHWDRISLGAKSLIPPRSESPDSRPVPEISIIVDRASMRIGRGTNRSRPITTGSALAPWHITPVGLVHPLRRRPRTRHTTRRRHGHHELRGRNDDHVSPPSAPTRKAAGHRPRVFPLHVGLGQGRGLPCRCGRYRRTDSVARHGRSALWPANPSPDEK